MATKTKINLENFNDIEMISYNEDNAVYRVLVSPSAMKKMTQEEKQRIRKNFIETTVHYFDLDDLNRLKEIEQNIQNEYKEEKQKKSLFSYLYNFLEI